MPEPLQGEGLRAYAHMARKLRRVLELLNEATVVDVVANCVLRVAVHGAEAAIHEHQVPSALARGIAVGLFHASALIRQTSGERGSDG